MPFWSENRIHFAHFGLESGMVFMGTMHAWECMNVFIVSVRKIEKYANSK